jgi:hypothetical protein
VALITEVFQEGASNLGGLHAYLVAVSGSVGGGVRSNLARPQRDETAMLE